MNTARKGRRVEHRVRAVLEWSGFWIMRAAGSKGACDLIAKKTGMEALISIKSNGYPSVEERRRLAEIPDSGNSVRWVIRWPDRKEPILHIVNIQGAYVGEGEWLDYVRWKRAQKACASPPKAGPGPSAAAAPSRSARE